MFVGMVRWSRGGPWRWRIVLRPVPPLSSASTSDHRKATFLPGRSIYLLGGYWYIVVVPSGARSIFDIEIGSAPRSLSLVHTHTGPCLPRWFDRDIHWVLPYRFGVEPARSLPSTIIGYTAAGCVCLGVLHQLVLRFSLYSLAGHFWGLLGTVQYWVLLSKSECITVLLLFYEFYNQISRKILILL